MPLTQSPGKIRTIEIRTIALLGAFCFFLSVLEYMVPKPLPFIRLGLAMLPLLLALDILPFSSFAILVGLKVIGQALISGTLFSYVFLFSLGGTGFSALLMYLLRRGLGKERISLIGVSAAGALASNAAQLVLAYYLVFGESVRYAAAPVLALGIVTGSLLGILSEYFIQHSRWYAGLDLNLSHMETQRHEDSALPSNYLSLYLNSSSVSSVPPCENKKKKFYQFRKAREAFCLKLFNPSELAAAGLCMIPALLLNPDTVSRAIQFLFFFFLAWLMGKKINLFLMFSVMLAIVFFNLLVPYGELLFSIGPLAITSGALMGGIRRAVTLEGLLMLSRCCISRDIALPSVLRLGAFGEIAGESFRIFSHLTEEKQPLNRHNWVSRLDALLIAYGETSTLAAAEAREPKPGMPGRNFASRIILAAAVILAWLPFMLTALF